MNTFPDHAALTAKTIAESMLNTSLASFQDQNDEQAFPKFPAILDLISGYPIDSGWVTSMETDDQIAVLELSKFTERAPSQTLDIEELRFEIEIAVCHVLHYEAEALALEILKKLEGWLNQFSFGLHQVRLHNRFESAPLQRFRNENEMTSVYAYALLGGEQINVWQFRHELLSVFVHEHLVAGEV